MIGPFRGGRTVAASGVPGNTNVFYVAANNGGVWKTTDAGRIVDARSSTTSPRARSAPSPSRRRAPTRSTSGAARACSGPTSPSATASTSRRTRGRRGRTSAFATPSRSRALAVHPRTRPRLRGGPRPPVRRERERGVFRSTDGGKTWTKVLYKDENTGASAVALDPTNPDVVYAVLWAARQGPWENGAVAGARERPLQVARTAGRRGGSSRKGLPTFAEGLGRIGVRDLAGPTRGASTPPWTRSPREEAGIYVSDDAGESFGRVNGEKRVWGRGDDFAEIACAPEEPRRGLGREHVDVPVDGRREDVRAREGRAGRRRLPHDLHSTPRTPTSSSSRPTRARRSP